MNAQDLVEYQGKPWLVTRVQEDFGVVNLTCVDGSRAEVPDDLDQTKPEELKVVAHPPSQWPMIAVPSKPGYGPFISVEVPGVTTLTALIPWKDWVPADPVREGGTLFFNPELRLRPGQVLVATFKNGKKARLTITKSFLTVGQRVSASIQKNAPPVPVEERNRFNRVLLEDD